ncbi:hypothetical protein BaRGS_00028315 [Batillaria attramentaria]|uniref:Uncharacterized protein n=1 Tax=Batillaria attramentaria TaxID=370345 RepID=A0ABD0JZ89_9CAEN
MVNNWNCDSGSKYHKQALPQPLLPTTDNPHGRCCSFPLTSPDLSQREKHRAWVNVYNPFSVSTSTRSPRNEAVFALRHSFQGHPPLTANSSPFEPLPVSSPR